MKKQAKKPINFPKIVLCGYYGHGNFGDEVILKYITTDIKNNFKTPLITVISNNPSDTKETYQVDSVYKYNFFRLLSKIFSCDVFISGGGSLFQDVTSFKSLIYYLLLLFIAKIFKKKTFVYAQGIGPLKSIPARFLAAYVLKKVDIITVRDKKSSEILTSMGIKSIITADPAWNQEYHADSIEKNNRLKLVIQLRDWSYLNEAGLNTIADAVIANFKDESTQINLISLQPLADTEIMKSFKAIIKAKSPNYGIKLLSELPNEEINFCIAESDFVIAMRYHACLVAAKYNVPTLALSYDPKVESLAQEISIPCISLENMTFEKINNEIKRLISERETIKAGLQAISLEKAKKAEETVLILVKQLKDHCITSIT